MRFNQRRRRSAFRNSILNELARGRRMLCFVKKEKERSGIKLIRRSSSPFSSSSDRSANASSSDCLP